MRNPVNPGETDKWTDEWDCMTSLASDCTPTEICRWSKVVVLVDLMNCGHFL